MIRGDLVFQSDGLLTAEQVLIEAKSEEPEYLVVHGVGLISEMLAAKSSHDWAVIKMQIFKRGDREARGVELGISLRVLCAFRVNWIESDLLG